MPDTKRKRKTRLKGDAGKKLEKSLERLAYTVLVNLTIVVLYNNLILMALKKADMLLPFKMLVVTGLAFWLSQSILGIYYHYVEERTERPISLGLRIMSTFVSAVTMIFSIPSVLVVEAWLSLDINFDIPTTLAFASGMFATCVGLIFSFRRATESNS